MSINTTVAQGNAYATVNGTSWAEGMKMASEANAKAAAEREAADQARLAQGTSPAYMAKYAANLAATGRLTRKERAAIRRALDLGKTVPAELVEAL